jgi:hypothetical protein
MRKRRTLVGLLAALALTSSLAGCATWRTPGYSQARHYYAKQERRGLLQLPSDTAKADSIIK